MTAQLRVDGVLSHNAADKFRGGTGASYARSRPSAIVAALGGPQAMLDASLLDRSLLSIQRASTPSPGAMSHVPTTPLRRPRRPDFRGESEGENDSRS
jgi:hypothetical protein